MKKILAIALCVIVMCGLLTGCNENIGFGNYNWKHVHFTDNVEGHCATITSWHDNTTGIELHTKECGSMFLSESSYILFDEATHCPYCNN